MKKYLAIMMCAGLLFTATGCGEEEKEDDSSSKRESTKVEEKKEKTKTKVVNCLQSDDDEKYSSTFTYDLEGETLLDVTLKYTLRFDDDELEEAEDYTDGLCDRVSSANPVKKCNAKISGNKVIADLEYDVDKLGEDDTLQFDKTTSIIELIEIMEEDDGTCKVEEK